MNKSSTWSPQNYLALRGEIRINRPLAVNRFNDAPQATIKGNDCAVIDSVAFGRDSPTNLGSSGGTRRNVRRSPAGELDRVSAAVRV